MRPYDFVFDHCANGQQLKCLTVTDEFTKEGLAIDDGRTGHGREELRVTDRQLLMHG